MIALAGGSDYKHRPGQRKSCTAPLPARVRPCEGRAGPRGIVTRGIRA